MDNTAWMPTGLDPARRDEIAALWPDDAHMAAAVAWERYAATLDADPVVVSASTGDQSVSYGPAGASAHGAAMTRAAWHRSRARAVNVPTSVPLVFGTFDRPAEDVLVMDLNGGGKITLFPGVDEDGLL